MRATVTSKGQVTLPAKLREKLGLRQGDQIEFEQAGGEWTVKPVRPAEDNPFAEFVGIAPLEEDVVTFWRERRGDADEVA